MHSCCYSVLNCGYRSCVFENLTVWRPIKLHHLLDLLTGNFGLAAGVRRISFRSHPAQSTATSLLCEIASFVAEFEFVNYAFGESRAGFAISSLFRGGMVFVGCKGVGIFLRGFVDLSLVVLRGNVATVGKGRISSEVVRGGARRLMEDFDIDGERLVCLDLSLGRRWSDSGYDWISSFGAIDELVVRTKIGGEFVIVLWSWLISPRWRPRRDSKVPERDRCIHQSWHRFVLREEPAGWAEGFASPA